MDNEIKFKLFVDLDGTAAEFKNVSQIEQLYEPGYFYNLKPNMNVINAVKEIIKNRKSCVEVYILSAYLSDSKYALDEKKMWCDKYFPEIDDEHRLFPTCGEDKTQYIAKKFGEINEQYFLLDDYSKNLHSWEPPARGIKIMNGINGTQGTWQGNSLSLERESEDLARCIGEIMFKVSTYHDLGSNNEVENVEMRRGNGR